MEPNNKPQTSFKLRQEPTHPHKQSSGAIVVANLMTGSFLGYKMANRLFLSDPGYPITHTNNLLEPL